MTPNPYWLERRQEDLMHLAKRADAAAQERLAQIAREFGHLPKEGFGQMRLGSQPRTVVS
jgi:hypothetical protein